MCFTPLADYETLEGMGQTFSTSEYKGQSTFPVNVWGVRSVARHL